MVARVVHALVRKALPAARRQALRRTARRLRHLGRGRYCPVCGARCRAFLPDARTGRPDATCPVCGSRERHRSLWPFLIGATPLATAAPRVLHVAPEPCFARGLGRLRLRRYVTLDLARGDVAVRADLSRLALRDASFDLALCNHVLEHVPDDRAALRELFRVLAPGGTAVVTVPGPDPALGFAAGLAQTVEDPDALGPEARQRRFGHPGHLRQYGRDLALRLREAGFSVAFLEVGADLPAREKARRGLFDAYPVYLCRKS
jgi:hypothetical protein